MRKVLASYWHCCWTAHAHLPLDEDPLQRLGLQMLLLVVEMLMHLWLPLEVLLRV